MPGQWRGEPHPPRPGHTSQGQTSTARIRLAFSIFTPESSFKQLRGKAPEPSCPGCTCLQLFPGTERPPPGELLTGRKPDLHHQEAIRRPHRRGLTRPPRPPPAPIPRLHGRLVLPVREGGLAASSSDTGLVAVPGLPPYSTRQQTRPTRALHARPCRAQGADCPLNPRTAPLTLTFGGSDSPCPGPLFSGLICKASLSRP